MKKIPIYIKFGIFIVYIISKTWRIKIDYPLENGVIAFWHSDMMPVWYAFSKFNSSAIVSTSKDGEILTAILVKWGLNVIRGSSSKGGSLALDMMIEEAKMGNYVLITPDGPQGPAKKMKAGAILTSIRANVPFYFANVEISKSIVFEKSWDKFRFPYPFAKINISLNKEEFENREYSRDEIEKIILNLENKSI